MSVSVLVPPCIIIPVPVHVVEGLCGRLCGAQLGSAEAMLMSLTPASGRWCSQDEGVQMLVSTVRQGEHPRVLLGLLAGKVDGGNGTGRASGEGSTWSGL